MLPFISPCTPAAHHIRSMRPFYFRWVAEGRWAVAGQLCRTLVTTEDGLSLSCHIN